MTIIEDYRPATKNYPTIWRTDKYDLDSGPDIARYVARTRYAFPGGYELAVITDDGGILCHDCCKTEYYQIRTSFPGDGWNVTAIWNTANSDDVQHCDHCSKTIG